MMIPDDPKEPLRGRPKGIPKHANSGRKLGTVNRSTTSRKGIQANLIKKEDYLKLSMEDKLKVLMDNLWTEAVFKNVHPAAKHWFDMYAVLGDMKYLGGYKFVESMQIIDSLDTFQEMNMFAEHVMKQVLKGILTPGAATLLFNLLKEREHFKKVALEPILTELLQVEKDRQYNGHASSL